MHLVQWVTFALHSNQIKTLVHFFPSAGSMTAPYPAQCKITAFGETIGLKSVTLDGGRVSQPDGICVNDIFPMLEGEKSALVGLIVELSTMQPRLSLESSGCVTELLTGAFSSRFRAARMTAAAAEVEESEALVDAVPLGLAIKDKYTKTSVLMLNAAESEANPDLRIVQCCKDSNANLMLFDVPTLPPFSAREVYIGDQYFNEAFSVEQSYGLHQCLPIVHQGKRVAQVLYYIVYRDASTGCPISVCAL